MCNKQHPYQRRNNLRPKVVRLVFLPRQIAADESVGRGPLPPRPTCRSQCIDGPRPCPWVSCKFNLYLDVNQETGAIRYNFPHLQPWEMEESCALDVADGGGLTLDGVAKRLNLVRERVRQIEVVAVAKLKRLKEAA